jgi:signal transduction histidine kinase
LSGINIHLGLEQNLTDPVQYRENIRICKGLIREAFEKIRIIANNVTPGIIEMYGLDAAVRSFIQTLQIQSELSVHFHSGLAGRRFSNEIELHFLRIICELINNSIKHSGATKITIHLSCSVDCLVLLYWDNGKGYDAAEKLKNSAGMGISNLFYRVNVIGGQLDFLQKRGKMIVRIMKNFST